MSESPVVVGIDVAKARLDLAVRPSGEQRQVSNDATGIAEVVAWLQELGPQIIPQPSSSPRTARNGTGHHRVEHLSLVDSLQSSHHSW